MKHIRIPRRKIRKTEVIRVVDNTTNNLTNVNDKALFYLKKFKHALNDIDKIETKDLNSIKRSIASIEKRLIKQ